ncbi:alpha/beta hydrolase [Kineococcus sp. GCM10028916]|uniref:alpha/beta hydrolase n=1 Tax=Kineococcus sp. GCM10028916 TaxID=3273394 RepID=UPI00364588E7
MSTLHLVDPELRDILDLLPARNFTVEELPAVRAAAAQLPLPELPPGLTVDEVRVPRDGAPDVRVLVTRPTALPAGAPALVWIHGGGYVVGSADADQLNAAQLALGVGMVVVSVDYGLAPENPHPGPVEDCYAALRWLHENADDLGVDRSRIAIGGGSAGGGLAAALGLLARDRGEVPVAFQYLVFPMIDDRTVTREANPTTGEFVWTRASNAFGWRALLGAEPGSDGVSPYAAAARAEELTGLPPTFLEVGSLDLFLDEDVEFALRLVRAGVPTELHVYPGAFHGYQMVATSTVARTSAELGVNALRRALG